MSVTTVTERPRRRIGLALGSSSDERLARLVAEGDERAFATLYGRYHQRLYRYVLAMLRNEADAQDALQSAFAAAYTALAASRRNAPLRPWLFRIAHNESVSLLRRRRPDAALSEVSDVEDVGVEEQAGRRSELQTLIADLRELPERQRAALVMRELSGLSHEEIAVALDVSPGSAKQTIFEARKSLMEFAAGREMSCEEIQRTISDGDGRAVRARRVRGHLGGCAACSAFAESIRSRRTTMRAIAPPLPALAAEQLLSRILRGGSGHGGGGIAVGASSAGKLSAIAGKLSATALSAKSVAGVAIVLTAGASAGLLHHALGPHGSAPVRPDVATPQASHVAPALVAGRHSVGAAITVPSPASPHATSALGPRAVSGVHRLRHGFWSRSTGHHTTGTPGAHGLGSARHAASRAGAGAGSHGGGVSALHAHRPAASTTGSTHRAAAGTGSRRSSTTRTRTVTRPHAPVNRPKPVRTHPVTPTRTIPAPTTSVPTTSSSTSGAQAQTGDTSTTSTTTTTGTQSPLPNTSRTRS